MAAQTTTELERVRYWQGQLLASGDLQTQLRVDEELRRLHNRAVHEAYGIAIGLGSAFEPGSVIKKRAEIVEGKLELPCGMAYDCAGRGLIVEEDCMIPLPPQLTNNLTLVLAYDPTSVNGIALRWMPAQDVNVNAGVAVTRLILNAGKAEIDPEFRPVIARPLARPRLATGNTIPGETPWKPWRIGDEEIGVQVEVDTSSEGFTRLPSYFAEAIADKPTVDFVPAWFASIADQSAQGFTFRLMLRRITRETLDIADPKVQVTTTPTIENLIVDLEKGNLLFKGDLVARLLPIAEQASLIEALASGTATLDFPLKDVTTTKQVAFGNPPRVDEVETVSDSPSFEVTVDTPGNFQEGMVVLKPDGLPQTAKPARIISIDDAEVMEIFPPITGLVAGDALWIVESGSIVDVVEGMKIKVADISKFEDTNVVLLVKDPVETSAVATIDQLDPVNKTLVLVDPINGLAPGNLLSIAKVGGMVQSATALKSEVRVKVKNNIKQFRAGDIVAKRLQDGSFFSPVRVRATKITDKILDLSGRIPGLQAGDTIAAADFRIRATVLEQPDLSQPSVTTVKVADSKVFSTPAPAFVAQIDDLLKASIPLQLKSIPFKDKLELAGTIQGLKAGDVIGLCAFPTTVEVKDVQDDGRIVVSNGALLHKSDVLTARPALYPHTGLAIVADIKGNVVRLAGAIPDLAAGDQLSVATVRGVIDVTPVAASNPPKVTVAQARLRVGDFLADITGWLQARPGTLSAANISEASGTQITLSARLDGLLNNDTIGLASLVPTLLQIRLNKMPDLRPGDEVLLVGLDRLQGETRSMFAFVEQVLVSANLALLVPEGKPSAFEFRPADLTASVLFVRGSALALIQKQDLFVSWLAVGVSDPMPKPCAGTAVPNCGCTAKE
jgi:hypothetical protein